MFRYITAYLNQTTGNVAFVSNETYVTIRLGAVLCDTVNVLARQSLNDMKRRVTTKARKCTKLLLMNIYVLTKLSVIIKKTVYLVSEMSRLVA